VCSAVVTSRFLKCVLLSHASHACDHTPTPPHTNTLQTIETTGQLPTPPACSTPIDRREILRRSSRAARKDSCTACERTAFTPCRKTHSAVDTRRRWREEPTSTWPNRRQPVARAALQPPRHPRQHTRAPPRRWSKPPTTPSAATPPHPHSARAAAARTPTPTDRCRCPALTL